MNIRHDIRDLFHKAMGCQSPPNLVSLRSKIVYYIFRMLYTISVSQGFFGRFSQIFTLFGMVLLLLDKVSPIKLSVNAIVIFFIVILLVAWILGRVMMELNCDRIDLQIGNERNIQLMDIHKGTVKEVEKI